MSALQKIMGTTVFLLLSTIAAVAQTNTKNLDELRAADAAWLKTYEAKDVDKAVAFCDDQGSLLWPNAPRATGKSGIANATPSAFAHPGLQAGMASEPEWRCSFQRASIYERHIYMDLQRRIEKTCCRQRKVCDDMEKAAGRFLESLA